MTYMTQPTRTTMQNNLEEYFNRPAANLQILSKVEDYRDHSKRISTFHWRESRPVLGHVDWCPENWMEILFVKILPYPLNVLLNISALIFLINISAIIYILITMLLCLLLLRSCWGTNDPFFVLQHKTSKVLGADINTRHHLWKEYIVHINY